MDKFKAISSFVRIVDRGSLTAAADELGVSLPSMVRTLAALERQLGFTLLNRTTRRMHLTDAGQAYLARCRTILAQVEDAESMLRSRRSTPQGRLAVTASVLFGTRHVAPLMNEFLRGHPAVTGELLLVDRVVNLVEEGFDAAVRIGPLPDSSLVAVPVGEVRRVVCASPAYLRAHGRLQRPSELRTHRCIRFTGLAAADEWTFRASPRKQTINSVLVTNQPDAAIEACVCGLGLGLFLSYMVAPLVRAGRLEYVLEDAEPEPLPINLVHPHARAVPPTVRAFVDLCAERLRSVRFV